MRRTSFLAALFLLFLLFQASGGFCQVETPVQTFADGLEYNEFVVNEQNKIGERILVLVATFQDTSAKKEDALEYLQAVILVSKNAIEKVEHVEAFPSGEVFKGAALNLFRFYNETFRLQYREIVDILFRETHTHADGPRLDELFKRIQEGETFADNVFTKAQVDFAEKNDFKLKNNEFQDQFREK